MQWHLFDCNVLHVSPNAPEYTPVRPLPKQIIRAVRPLADLRRTDTDCLLLHKMEN